MNKHYEEFEERLINQNISRSARLRYFTSPLTHVLCVSKTDICIFNHSPCVRTKVKLIKWSLRGLNCQLMPVMKINKRCRFQV